MEDADSGYGRQVYVESLTPEDIVKAHLGPTNLKETESLEGRIRAVGRDQSDCVFYWHRLIT